MNDKVLKILLEMDQEQLYLMFDYCINDIRTNSNNFHPTMQDSKYFEESEKKLFKTVLKMRQLIEVEG